MKKRLGICLLALMMTMSFCLGALAEEDTGNITIQLLSAPQQIGDTVQVQVGINKITAKTFYAADVVLYYNPTVLKCTDEPTMGQQLSDSGIMTKIYTKTDDSKGLVRYAVGMTPEGYQEEGFAVPSGEMELFTVSFEVIGQGDMNLQVGIKDSAPAYIDNYPQGAELYLGHLLEKAAFDYQKVSYVIGEKGDALISEILPIDPITVAYGTEDIASYLPGKVSVKLDDGSVKEMGMTWSGYLSTYDPTVAGTYLFRGELQEEAGYRNHQGLFSILTVTVKPQEETGGDSEQNQQGTDSQTGSNKPAEPEENKPDQEPSGTDTNEELFQDLDTVPWAAEKIVALAKDGVISGVAEHSFAPNEPVTRAQFAAMLIRAFDLLDETASCDFTDIPEGAWYYQEVASAKAAGITAGYEDNTFRPDALITRQEMAAMAFRTAGLAGLTLTPTVDPVSFSDEGMIEEYAAEAISAMQQSGVISGMGDGCFGPGENATRAQAAVIIYQLYRLK